MRYMSLHVGYGARGRMGLGLNKPKRKPKVDKVKTKNQKSCDNGKD